jgi:hypothetical protein
LDIARQIQESFLSDPQGPAHQTPKTLSIINFDVYEDFATKWNAFSKAVVDLLAAEDPEISITLNRARQSAYSFASVYDGDGAKDKASVDMMSFMVDFQKLCRPKTDSELSNSLQVAMTAYNFMFVERGTGPGTPSALTGMHIFWPSKQRYSSGDFDWDSILFEAEATATTSAPEWLNLLKSYYSTQTPPTGGSSVCETSTALDTDPSDGQLLINPNVSPITNGGHDVAAGISRSVDTVLIEYGVDLTPLYTRRQLKHDNNKRQADEQHLLNPRFKNRRVSKRRSRRHLDDSGNGNVVFQFGGDLLGTYEGANYESFWDRTFFVVGDSNVGYSDIYVFDYGEGAKEFPVFYYPPRSSVTSEAVGQMNTFQDAIDAGGEHGYVSFSTQNEVNGLIGGLTLFTLADRDNESFSETPRSRGGQVVPVVFMDAIIGGEEFYYFIGGDSAAVIEWNENDVFGVTTVAASTYLANFNLQGLTIDLFASDDYTGDASYAFFDISADGDIALIGEGNIEGTLVSDTDDEPGDGPGGGDGGSGSRRLSADIFTILMLGSATLLLLPTN